MKDFIEVTSAVFGCKAYIRKDSIYYFGQSSDDITDTLIVFHTKSSDQLTVKEPVDQVAYLMEDEYGDPRIPDPDSWSTPTTNWIK